MGGSDLANKDERAFLAENEEPRLQWEGVLIEGEDEERAAEFVVTDDRLIYSYGPGHFKDIGLNHIESVEVGTDTEKEYDGAHPNGIIGFGALCSLSGIGMMMFGGFSGASVLAGLAVLGFGGYAIYWGLQNYDDMVNGYEVTEHEVQHIMVETSTAHGLSDPIYFETRENIGMDLSRLIQESK